MNGNADPLNLQKHPGFRLTLADWAILVVLMIASASAALYLKDHLRVRWVSDPPAAQARP